MGLPAVVVGPPEAGGPLASVWSDDAVSMTEAVEHLAALGHRRIARVAGIRELAHTRTRTRAFETACTRLAVAWPETVWTDYSGEDGARATQALLGLADPPTAVIYDNDIMAVAGLAVAQEMGRVVPADLAIVALVAAPVRTISKSIRAACAPNPTMSRRTTVSGGPTIWHSGESSPATIDTSAGTARPSSRAAPSPAIAITSLS
jgi:DNA-binding LacI/PurR family transcriptional regulator